MARQNPQGLIPWKNALEQMPRLVSFPAIWDDFLTRMSELETEHGSSLTISEDKKNVYVEAALPGLKSEDIEVTLDKGVLWIRGEKKEEEEDKDKKFYRRATNSFSYRLSLPGQVDETKEPKAVYQNGMMKITFVKAQQHQAKKITVKGA